jgi:Ca-activated chloride channel homolog
VELRYTELLIPEDGIYRFVYPTVVGPRYSNKTANRAPVTDQWVANPYTHKGENPSYSFNLNCGINAGMPISDIHCPSHKTNIKFEGSSTANITLDPSELAGGNKDFILEYRLAGNKIETGLLLYPGEKENFFLAIIQPPEEVKLADIPPREYVFIMDVSGSMTGFPLNISKSLMHDLIGNLRTEDRFNILLFAGGSQLFSENSLQATPANLKKAMTFIDNENGGGGTELLPALRQALALKGTEGFARSFIIATDGYVDVEREAFDLIRKNLDKANFFPFGIGSSVNRYLIEGIAHAGSGMPFIVTEENSATVEAMRFREYIQQPVLSHVKLNLHRFNTYDVEPISVPDVFSYRPVIVFGKYRGNPVGVINISGVAASGKYEKNLEVSNYKPISSNSALRYLWARERIRNLDDYAQLGDENKSKIVSLGLEYNLLTQYTSFLAVDSETRNHTGSSTTINQPLPLPEGVEDQAVGFGTVSCSKLTISKEEVVMEAADVKGNSTDRDAVDLSMENKTEPIFCIVETMPEYPGGDEKLKQFLHDNLRYPKTARESCISGTVYVTFVIEKDGSVSNVKVMRGIGGGCDEEAIRVVQLMPKWKPGMQMGKAVRVQYNLPIKFIL